MVPEGEFAFETNQTAPVNSGISWVPTKPLLPVTSIFPIDFRPL